MSETNSPPKSMEKRRTLIVNADDFGFSPAVNAGIVRAHREGILTSATLLANAPAFEEAVGLAREHPGLGVGLHLNLVRGRALSPGDEIPSLLGDDGNLRRFRLRRLSKRFLDAAEREYRRQFEKTLQAGIRPTHIDFEKHHAWQGPLYLLACRLANEYGVKAARIFREPVVWTLRNLGWPGLMPTALAGLLRIGFSLGGGGGTTLRTADRLLGQCHIGGMTEAVWLRLAGKLPEGITEVMTHPGESEKGAAAGGKRAAEGKAETAMGASWLGESRGRELAALVSPAVREALRGVELSHYGRVFPGL